MRIVPADRSAHRDPPRAARHRWPAAVEGAHPPVLLRDRL